MTTTALLIFITAFLSVFLRCVQVVNLSKNKRGMVALTSVGIAAMHLAVIKAAIAVNTLVEGTAFILGGLIGACLSMCVSHKQKEAAELKPVDQERGWDCPECGKRFAGEDSDEVAESIKHLVNCLSLKPKKG